MKFLLQDYNNPLPTKVVGYYLNPIKNTMLTYENQQEEYPLLYNIQGTVPTNYGRYMAIPVEFGSPILLGDSSN